MFEDGKEVFFLKKPLLFLLVLITFHLFIKWFFPYSLAKKMGGGDTVVFKRQGRFFTHPLYLQILFPHLSSIYLLIAYALSITCCPALSQHVMKNPNRDSMQMWNKTCMASLYFSVLLFIFGVKSLRNLQVPTYMGQFTDCFLWLQSWGGCKLPPNSCN